MVKYAGKYLVGGRVYANSGEAEPTILWFRPWLSSFLLDLVFSFELRLAILDGERCRGLSEGEED